jgi:hypothetical protein
MWYLVSAIQIVNGFVLVFGFECWYQEEKHGLLRETINSHPIWEVQFFFKPWFSCPCLWWTEEQAPKNGHIPISRTCSGDRFAFHT